MYSFKKIFSFVILLFSINLDASANAGNDRGNGGDAYCAEYIDLVGRVGRVAKSKGQSTLKNAHASLNLSDVLDISTNLRCEPIEAMDRIARTKAEKDGYLTTLNTPKWSELSFEQKLKLVSHEMLIGLGVEGEGQYGKSLKLYDVVYSSDEFSKYKRSEVTEESPRKLLDGARIKITPITWMQGPSGGFYKDYIGWTIEPLSVEVYESKSAGVSLFVGPYFNAAASYFDYTNQKIKKNWFDPDTWHWDYGFIGMAVFKTNSIFTFGVGPQLGYSGIKSGFMYGAVVNLNFEKAIFNLFDVGYQMQFNRAAGYGSINLGFQLGYTL